MTALAEPRTVESVPTPVSAPTQRLMSVDALRGFDMFWITGAGSLLAALNEMSQTAPTRFLATQLEHADWEGFHFEDLIFPLFVFIVGVSLVFSLTKTLEQAGRAEALKRVLRRGILLFLVGIFYSGGIAKAWPDIRVMGVLNRIALAYLFGGLLFCFFKPRTLAAICAGLLIGYWGLLSFVPIRDIQLTRNNVAKLAQAKGDTATAQYLLDPDSPNPSAVKASAVWSASRNLFYATTDRVRGKFGKGYNLSDHIDFQYLPGRKYDTFFDPEGILSTIPAVATCLLGVFAGLLLREPSLTGQRKVLYLVGFGIAGVVAGWLWNLQFPVIKKIWTSSYVLVAGGYSALLLAVFYWIVDVRQQRAWCQPFVWIGMNSITIYLANNIIGGFGKQVGTRLAGGDVKDFFDAHLGKGAGDMLIAIAGLMFAFWFVHFLYRRKIFLRL
jgi:predicted acyltransferase